MPLPKVLSLPLKHKLLSQTHNQRRALPFLKYLLSNKSQLKLKVEKLTLRCKESQRPIIIMTKKMTQELTAAVTQLEVKAEVLLYCE